MTRRRVRDARALSVTDNVHRIARSVARDMPGGLDADDLYSEGMIAVLRAADRWDPDGGADLDLFLCRRAKGAMVDAVREWTGHRRKTKVHVLSMDALPEGEDEKTPDWWLPPTEDETVTGPAVVNDMLARLPPRERQVMFSLVTGVKTNRQTAADMGVHESRATQLKNRACRRLRDQLGYAA